MYKPDRISTVVRGLLLGYIMRTRPPKKQPTANDDPAVGVQDLSLDDPENERSSSVPEEEMEDDEDADDDADDDEETLEQMLGLQSGTRKTKIPARSTAAEDRATCIAWYELSLNLKHDAAKYLYDQEDLTKPSNWAKLNEKTIGMIVKNCRDSAVHVNATAANKMVLLAFLCMHQERIQRPLLELTSVDEDILEDIERQKQLEDRYMNEKVSSDPPSLPLDDANVTKSISTIQTDLNGRRGITGIPLSYVIRFSAQVPAAHQDPPFGADDSNYSSMDDEMIRRAQIYSRDVNVDEVKGPFSKVFLIDSATVYTLLEKAFGKTSFWTNVRVYSKKKEGRKAWISLIKFHFGNDRATTMADLLRSKLMKATFAGPKRSFTFTQYCNLHTSTHTTASEILMYQEDQTPIFSESNKIMLFQTGVTDPYFTTVKALISSQRYKYSTFDSVKEAYLNFMRTSPRPEYVPTNDPRHISATTTNRYNQTRGGPGKGGPGKSSKPPTQAEIDACDHIKCRKYSQAEYDKFTPAEKAKHYQLKHAAGLTRKRTVSQVETESNERNEKDGATGTVTNSNNPALVRQPKIQKPE